MIQVKLWSFYVIPNAGQTNLSGTNLNNVMYDTGLQGKRQDAFYNPVRTTAVILHIRHSGRRPGIQ